MMEVHHFSTTHSYCVSECCGEMATFAAALPCPKLDDLENGTITVDSYHVGSRATYNCAKEFKLIGPEVRWCLPTALWNGTTPVCVPNNPTGTLFINTSIGWSHSIIGKPSSVTRV